MGGGNRERQAATTAQSNYTSALQTAQTESPYERRRREFAEGAIRFAEGGDYRNPTGAMRVFFNFADPAERKRRSEVMANTRGTGVSAMGAGANPNLLAMNKQHQDDVAERDAAENYQNTLSTVVGGAYDELGELQGADTAKKLSVLGTTAGVNAAHINKPKSPSWLDRIFGMAERGAQAAAMTGGA